MSLNEAGFHVFAGCLFPDRDGARGLLIKAKHATKMTIIPIDVTNDLSVRLAYEAVDAQVKEQGVRLHALVNNAGICPGFELEWGSIELIKRVLDVNTMGMVLVTKTFLPLIRESAGRIVNVNSIAGRYSVPTLVPYCMSKHACLAFTEGLRREVAKFGVQVISIEPAFYGTPMANMTSIMRQMETIWHEADPGVKEAYGDHYFKRVCKQSPLLDPFINQDIGQVPAVIKHAVLNSCPQYNYMVAGRKFHWIYLLGLYVSPQESIESLFKMFSVFSGRNVALPGAHDAKKMT